MEIHAYCELNLESVQALCRLQMFRRANPKKRMCFWGIVYGVLIAVVVIEMFLFGPRPMLTCCLLLSTAVLLLIFYQYFLFPQIQYKALAKMKMVRNSYTFTDDTLRTVSEGPAIQGESVIPYSTVVKAMETTRYLFLFQTKNQVLLIDNATLSGGTVGDIRDKLQPMLGKKYIVCKY